MDLIEFENSLSQEDPPAKVNVFLRSMWWEAKGNWEEAHRLVEDDPSAEGAWVHAYLHRVEGDQFNAGYWYRRAGKSMSELDLPDEWKKIVIALLDI